MFRTGRIPLTFTERRGDIRPLTLMFGPTTYRVRAVSKEGVIRKETLPIIGSIDPRRTLRGVEPELKILHERTQKATTDTQRTRRQQDGRRGKGKGRKGPILVTDVRGGERRKNRRGAGEEGVLVRHIEEGGKVPTCSDNEENLVPRVLPSFQR